MTCYPLECQFVNRGRFPNQLRLQMSMICFYKQPLPPLTHFWKLSSSYLKGKYTLNSCPHSRSDLSTISIHTSQENANMPNSITIVCESFGCLLSSCSVFPTLSTWFPLLLTIDFIAMSRLHYLHLQKFRKIIQSWQHWSWLSRNLKSLPTYVTILQQANHWVSKWWHGQLFKTENELWWNWCFKHGVWKIQMFWKGITKVMVFLN